MTFRLPRVGGVTAVGLEPKRQVGADRQGVRSHVESAVSPLKGEEGQGRGELFVLSGTLFFLKQRDQVNDL